MTKLYYGNGDCTIEGTGIRAVEIRFRGTIEITKTANDNFAIAQRGNGIMIFPIGEGYLNDLFSYIGKLYIISIIVSDNNAERVGCTIKRVMDYSELLDSKSEDMTVKSEDLNAGHVYKGKVSKTRVIDNYIKSQHSNGELYFEDGTQYSGAYHVHLDTGRTMTGAEHTEESQDLYIKRIVDGKIVRIGTIRKTARRRTTAIQRGVVTGTGGYGSGGGGSGGGGY